MTRAGPKHGEPLAFLGALLLVWIAARVLAHLPDVDADGYWTDGYWAASWGGPAKSRLVAEAKEANDRDVQAFVGLPAFSARFGEDKSALRSMRSRTISANDTFLGEARALAHQELWMGAMGYPALATSFAIPMSWTIDRKTADQPPRPDRNTPPMTVASAQDNRWSAYGWTFLRDGGSATAAGIGRYGGSQAGAVVRYALAPDSRYRPGVYARVSRALNGSPQQEFAMGAALRPLPGVPVRVAAEYRLGLSRGARTAPSAYVYTELPPIGLPMQLRGEVYGQAGWVGGQNPTGFFDLQATAEHDVAEIGPALIEFGAGAWAGGQEGAQRLDLGPRAAMRLPVADGNARLSLDWRQRVAGDAAPASGLALTLAADF